MGYLFTLHLSTHCVSSSANSSSMQHQPSHCTIPGCTDNTYDFKTRVVEVWCVGPVFPKDLKDKLEVKMQSEIIKSADDINMFFAPMPFPEPSTSSAPELRVEDMSQPSLQQPVLDPESSFQVLAGQDYRGNGMESWSTPSR